MKTYRFSKSYIKRTFCLILSLVLLFSAFPIISSAGEEYGLPWLWPVPGSYKINCLDYYYDGGIHSQGQCIDIGSNGFSGDERLDIVSATSGRVLYIQNKYNETTNKGAGWGNYVIVESGNTYIVYAHLLSVSCTYGEIKAGQVIGKMGNTGKSTGVHLHMQAYPKNEGSSSTKIPVFEQYKLNPLYYEKFEFISGLEKYSIKYADHIKSHYTKKSGSYYKYSGGITADFEVTPVYASVMAISSSGASVKSLPVDENQYNVNTVSFGNTADISGYYTDAYGVKWLRLENGGGWIKSAEVGFYAYKLSLVYDGPTSLNGEYGSLGALPLSGNISSDNLIESYTVTVTSGKDTVISFTEPVGENSFGAVSVSNKLTAYDISDGTYKITLTVKESAQYPGVDPLSREETVIISEFKIVNALSDKTPPTIESLEFSSVDKDKVSLYCTAIDDKRVTKLELAVKRADNTEIGKFPFTENGGRYECSVDRADIGAGAFIFEVTAYDAYGNSDTRSKTLVLSDGALSETYTVTTTIKIRDLPSLSGTSTGSTLKKGATLTVTEIVEADNCIWGKHSKGWSALGEYETAGVLSHYTSYVSGNLYSVTFDLNGGTGDVPDVLAKRYGVSAPIPSVTPSISGCSFLGWAKDSGAKEPDYKIGDSFDENLSCTLFAVYKDTEAPKIESVKLSSEGWANSVTVTVTAKDNLSSLLYSFDGTQTWQSQNTFTVTENKTFAEKEIAVKDAAGNITYHNSKVTVSKIDTVPPTKDETPVAAAVGVGGVTFTFGGFADSESGISHYEAALSKNPDMSELTSYTIKSGDMLSLGDGVYYCEIAAYDNAGNRTGVKIDRFRIGEGEKLAAPTGLTVLSSNSDYTDIEWNEVENADYYKVGISRDPTFLGEAYYISREITCKIASLQAGSGYYVRVSAHTDDGAYLDSDFSHAVSFTTLGNDTEIKGMSAIEDALIDNILNKISYTAEYGTQTLDITVKADPSATVEYYSDHLLTQRISTPRIYTLTSDDDLIYIKVTAETQASEVYEFALKRAARKAAEPVYEYTPVIKELIIGQSCPEISLSAISPDGGTLDIKWFIKCDGGEVQEIGSGTSITPELILAGVYEINAVIMNYNPKCEQEYTPVSTPYSVITVVKKTASISVSCSGYTYSGSTPMPTSSGYVGDGEIGFEYYTDEDCLDKIDAPSDAGTYYVVAVAKETLTYSETRSTPLMFKISKADNSAKPAPTVTQPTIRDELGYIEVSESGVEYRLEGQSIWKSFNIGKLSFNVGDRVELRFAEVNNYNAGQSLFIDISEPQTASDITPKEDAPMKANGTYLLVDRGSSTASYVLSMLENSSGIKIYDESGAPLSGEHIIKNGYEIRIEDEVGVFKSLILIVVGDIDCDGAVTEDDALTVMLKSNGMERQDGEYDLLTGDIDGDGAITSKDAYLVLERAQT